MAKFRLITEQDEIARVTALRKSSKSRLTGRMAEYDTYLAEMADGEALEFEADEGETLRSITMRISRAAKRLSFADIRTWVSGDRLYVGRGTAEQAAGPYTPVEPKAKRPKALKVVEQASI